VRDRRAVLLMAYGGPASLDEVEAFLLDVRGGRETPRELVEEVRGRYAAIGGASPLAAITRAQAAALEEHLAGDPAAEYRVFVGMRHGEPRIARAVGEMAAQGRRRLVALCLAPHYSRLSVGAYLARLDEALAAVGGGFEAVRVESWHDHPGFLDAVAERVVEALAEAAPAEVDRVVFTAHSLPARIVAEGDPYDAQLRATCQGVAARVEAARGRPLPWTFAYQSAAYGARDWLGPSLEETLPALARQGHRTLLACPVGFVSDHVEVLYDLDVEARRLAAEHGATLRRTRSLDTSPTFVAALAGLVTAAARAFPG